MSSCPNISSPEFVELAKEYGHNEAVLLYHMNGEDIPSIEEAKVIVKPNQVQTSPKILGVLSSDKIRQLYNKFYKTNPEKFYQELIPLAGKQQIDLLKEYNRQYNPQSLDEMLAGIAAQMSYTVEINTAKQSGSKYIDEGNDWEPDIRLLESRDYFAKQLFEEGNLEPYSPEFNAEVERRYREHDKPRNSQYYSNLTVPGGTNYTENEISTPGITPSIKGHAQFSTENGVGWFRSDDRGQDIKDRAFYYDEVSKEHPELFGEEFNDEVDRRVEEQTASTAPKTRRILEVQSDLFQKGRDKEQLVGEQTQQSHIGEQYEEYLLPDGNVGLREKQPIDNTKNQFLQLLNKDNNWVRFFIQSIVQDSAKKGYEKILFPVGDTASKVEGHETLEEFKKQKEERLDRLQGQVNYLNELVLKDTKLGYVIEDKDGYTPMAKYQLGGSYRTKGEARDAIEKTKYLLEPEVHQLQQELKRVETEGFGALKPIWNFYENTVGNTLKKIYGKDGVVRIKDEYGNEWYEVGIEQQRDSNHIYFQVQQPLEFRDAVDRIVTGFKGLRQAYPNSRTMWNYFTTGKDSKLANTTIAQAVREWIANKPQFRSVGVLEDRGNKNIIQLVPVNTYNQLTNKNLKNELQSLLNRAVSGRLPEDSIGAVISFIRRGQKEGEGYTGGQQDREQLWRQVQESGLEYKGDRISPEKELERGSENIAYKENDIITKVRYTIEPVQIERYLKQLLVYNRMFPEMAYRFLGFTKVTSAQDPGMHKGTIAPVVEQNYILPTTGYDYSAIENTLSKYGLKEVEQYKFKDDVSGIVVEDLMARNVIFNKGVPFFIDPMIDVEAEWFENPGENINDQIVSSRQPANKNLDKTVERFLDSIGVEVKRLKDEGQNFAAMADTINGIISVVEGKAGIETLGHEATHLFLDLLPEDSKLLKDILQQVRNTDQYDDTIEQYGKLPEYTLPDGKVDEIKIAKEAAAHVIDDIIVGRYKEQKAMKWWQKLWKWVQNIFKGKSLDAFSQVAEDILTGNTARLSAEKIQAIKEANRKGEIYYELSPRDKAYVKGVRGMATTMQQKVIDMYLNPTVVLDEKTHTYTQISDKNITYSSVTTLLNGKTHLDPEDFALNKAWGNDFDAIIQGIALGKDIEDIPTNTLKGEERTKAFGILSEFYNEIVGEGDIVLTQVIVSDPVTRVAGSIDLLVVHPDGTTDIIDLKTIGKDKSYNTQYTPGEGAVIKEPLSRKQKHAIQVATYRRLLGIMGFPGSRISAIYVKLDIEGERKEQVLKGFDKGDRIPFTETSWDTYARVIVPTEPSVDKTEPDPVYTEEEMTPDDDKEVDTSVPREETEKKLDQVLNDISNLFDNRLRYFDALEKGGGSFRPNISTIKGIEDLVFNIGQERSKGKKEAAYGRFLSYAQKEVDSWARYIANKNNYKDQNYFNVVDEVIKFMRSYETLPWVRRGVNAEQQKLVQKLEDSLDNLGDVVAIGAFGYIKDKVGETYPNMSPEDIDTLLTIQQDISAEALVAHDVAGSRDKLAAALDITIKRALDTIARKQQEQEEELRRLGNEYEKVVGKIDKDSFNFMYDGNKILKKIDNSYYAKKTEIDSLTIGEDGEYMEYNLIFDPKSATDEQIEHNKNLAYIKQERNEFYAAEQIKDGKAIGGEYHEYTPEYIAEREKVMRLVHRRNSSVWQKRSDVSEAEYNRFRQKYMLYNPYWGMTYKKGKPTGFVKRVADDSAWFPRKEYIQIREVTESGKDMVNPRYKKLMNPQTELERAQKKVYELYMDTMGRYADILGPDAQRKLKEGDRISLMGSWVQQASDNGTLNTAKKYISNQMTPTVFAREVITDETGTVRQSIPKLYMQGLQNQDTIVRLNNRIQDLANQKAQGKLTLKDYNALVKETKTQLKVEQSKLTPDQLEYDIFKQLIAYSNMAENFTGLSAIEGTVKAYVRAVSGDIKTVSVNTEGEKIVREGRKYYDTNAKGEIITVPGTNEPAVKGDPNVVKRVRSLVSQVFYEDKNLTKTQTEVYVKRVMNWSSLLSVGLNIFGNINNYVLGKVNAMVDAASGKYYERGAYWRAQKAMTGTIIPGIISKIGDGKNGTYGKKKAATKEEALLDKYRVVREQKSGEENVSLPKWMLAYKGAQAGEYAAQGVPGLAILMSTDNKLNKGIRVMTRKLEDGLEETCSIADAHEFINGELRLKKGFTETPEDLFRTTNYIFEVNKNIHGSYAPEDMLYMQKWLLGKMVLQFHKHIIPAIKNRFAKNYEHPTLGEVEGRYRTALEFVKGLSDVSGNWAEKIIGSWHNLSDIQKKNMLQNGAEILMITTAYATYVLVSGIAQGLDPDDDPYLKRMAHFLSYQSSRIYSEQLSFISPIQMYQYAKNPMAINTIAKNFGETLLYTTELPFQVDYGNGSFSKGAIYQRGPYKGQLKAAHQWRKMIPLISNIEKWNSLAQQTKFSLIGT